MKHRGVIRWTGAVALAAVAPVALFAQAQTPPQQNPAQPGQQTPARPNPGTAAPQNAPIPGTGSQHQTGAMGATSVSSMDRQFMQTVSQGNLAEVKTGELALKKSKDSGVKQVAQQLVNDHSKAQTQLESLARSKNVTLPSAPNSSQMATYTKLSNLSGSRFDDTYLSGQIRDHAATINLFHKEIKSGSDPAVMAWARQTLPVISGHAGHLKQEARRIGAPVPSGQKSASAH